MRRSRGQIDAHQEKTGHGLTRIDADEAQDKSVRLCRPDLEGMLMPGDPRPSQMSTEESMLMWVASARMFNASESR